MTYTLKTRKELDDSDDTCLADVIYPDIVPPMSPSRFLVFPVAAFLSRAGISSGVQVQKDGFPLGSALDPGDAGDAGGSRQTSFFAWCNVANTVGTGLCHGGKHDEHRSPIRRKGRR